MKDFASSSFPPFPQDYPHISVKKVSAQKISSASPPFAPFLAGKLSFFLGGEERSGRFNQEVVAYIREHGKRGPTR
jgi:hypothetical protein